MVMQPTALVEPGNQQVRVKRDSGKQIVEIVRNSAHQSPDHLHLLRFTQTLLGPLTLRDVLGHADSKLWLPIHPAYHRDRETNPPDRRPFTHIAKFQFVGISLSLD